MKKLLQLSILLSLSIACSEHKQAIDNIVETDEITHISFTIPSCEFEDEDVDTKVTVSRDNSGTNFLWEITDTLGIFANEGCQLYFCLEDGNGGGSSASFDGGGWAMKREANYYSYLPFVADYYIDKKKIPITFLGQKQEGNATETFGDIGKYWYMACKGVLSQDGTSLSFKFDYLGLVNRIIVPVVEGTYESLTLNAGSNCIAYEGTFNGIEIDKEINDAKYTDKLTIKLEDVSFDSRGTLYVYMVTPPFKNLGGQISYEVRKTDGTVLCASTAGKNYNPGAAAQKPNFSIYPQASTVSGKGGSTTLEIITDKTTLYEVTTDANWLTLDSSPVSGAATITITASENPGNRREGHVTVSETVTVSGQQIVLRNVMTIVQLQTGMNVDQEDWGEGDKVEGEVGGED